MTLQEGTAQQINEVSNYNREHNVKCNLYLLVAVHVGKCSVYVRINTSNPCMDHSHNETTSEESCLM
jgi:hypothetical protein